MKDRVCMFLEEDFEGVRSLSDLGMIPDDIDGLYLGRRRVPITIGYGWS